MVPVPPLRPQQAQLWFFDLEAAQSEIDVLSTLLDPAEQARAGRFRFERDRAAFIVAHARLRQLLGASLGRPPETVPLVQPPGEKPVLDGRGGLHFSLSHSGSIGMVGLAPQPIGVDVEAIRPLADRDAITRRFFAAEEVAGLMALPEPARHEAFFACWTRKEAYVKTIGLGLTAPLDGFVVSIGEAARLCSVAGQPAEAECWSMWGARLEGAAWAAAATREPLMTYTLFDRRPWQPE